MIQPSYINRSAPVQADPGLYASQLNFETNPSESSCEMQEDCELSNAMSICSDTSSQVDDSGGNLRISSLGKVQAKSSSLRNKTLSLTLRFDEEHLLEDLINDFHSTFQTYRHELEKTSEDETSATFVVKFESIMMAQGALILAAVNGFQTTPDKLTDNVEEQNTISGEGKLKHSLVPRRFVRPSPTLVCRFKVLSEKLTVRSGRLLSSQEITLKCQNDVVYVNRIKGRRARLVNRPDGVVTMGWASLFSESGIPLLEQLE